jgi:hypothetical protein
MLELQRSNLGPTTEVHDDRRRVVQTVRREDNAVIHERPMTAFEIKSGWWLHPQRDAPTYHRAGSPFQYMQLRQSLWSKGFVPVDPPPEDS